MTLVCIRPSQIPAYLKAGKFFESLDASTDEEIELPDDVMKTDLQITNVAELEYQLRSLRFWGVLDMPYEVLDFILDVENNIDSLSVDFALDFPLLASALLMRPKFGVKRVWEAIRLNSLHLLKYLVDRGAEVPDYLCSTVSRDGNLEMLKYLLETLHLPVDARSCQNALASGNMPCLEYLRDRGAMALIAGYKTTTVTDPIGFNATPVADLQTLKFALAQGCVMSSLLMEDAATMGLLEIIQYAHENGCEWSTGAAKFAAHHNHLHILRYYHENGGQWCEVISRAAAQHGRLECLRYVCDNGCPVDFTVAGSAAYNGKLDCLQYLHSIHCPWGEGACNAACEGGQLECLKFLIENGCPVYNSALKLAELYGSRDCFDYLISKGITPPPSRR